MSHLSMRVSVAWCLLLLMFKKRKWTVNSFTTNGENKLCLSLFSVLFFFQPDAKSFPNPHFTEAFSQVTRQKKFWFDASLLHFMYHMYHIIILFAYTAHLVRISIHVYPLNAQSKELTRERNTTSLEQENISNVKNWFFHYWTAPDPAQKSPVRLTLSISLVLITRP